MRRRGSFRSSSGRRLPQAVRSLWAIFASRASPVGIALVVVVNSALRRRYPVSCALQVGNGVLPRPRPRAFLARSLRRPPGEDGRLELLPSRHWGHSEFPGRIPPIKHIRRGVASRVALILGVHGTEPTIARRRLRAEREARKKGRLKPWRATPILSGLHHRYVRI